jgi:hypothetical protein
MRQWRQAAPMTGDSGGEVLQLEEATGSEEGSTMVDNDGRREGSPCWGRSGGSDFNFMVAATLRQPAADKMSRGATRGCLGEQSSRGGEKR